MNIHGFMQLLCNRYFVVLVDHKAIEYMIKSKTESPTMRLNPFDTLTYPYCVHAVFCNLDALCRNLKENSNNYYFMPTNKFFYYINLT